MKKKTYLSPQSRIVVLNMSAVLTTTSARINSGETISSKNEWDAPGLTLDDDEEDW